MSTKSFNSMFFNPYGGGHDAFAKMHIAVLSPLGFLTSACGNGFNLVALNDIETERKEKPDKVAEDLEKYFCKRCLRKTEANK